MPQKEWIDIETDINIEGTKALFLKFYGQGSFDFENMVFSEKQKLQEI